MNPGNKNNRKIGHFESTKRTVFLCVLFVLGLCQPSLSGVTSPETEKNGVLDLLFREEKQLMKDAARDPGNEKLRKQVADLRANIAEELVQHHQYSMAMDYLHNSLSLDPSNAERWERLGDLFHFLGHPSSSYKAQYAYERALLNEPSRQSARAKLAGSCLQSERFLKAMEHYEVLISKDDGTLGWEPFGLLASIYAHLNEIQRGVSFFNKCLEHTKDDKVKLALAVLYETSGHRQPAIKLLDSVITSRGGRSPMALYAESLKQKYAGK
jgi:tetratricopeptide (TPR) repeat protein